jgi:hypothetical protein
MLLDPENTLFVRGATPVLLLAGAPVHEALPPLTAPGGEIPRCEGWSIVPRLTLCVVVGDTGDGTAPGHMADWCDDTERAGGAVVLSLDRLPETLDWAALLSSGTTHGGFLPALA